MEELTLSAFLQRYKSQKNQKMILSAKNLKDFKMETEDSEYLKILFSYYTPKRHLEIGTWKGFGTKLALENSPATVWTVNPWDGERRDDGSCAYSEPQQIQKTENNPQLSSDHLQTDAGASIGVLYREAKLAGRVCQIYCDSRQWDTTNYPIGFFDSVLIDGSHEPDMVVHDTKKTTSLLRSGGIMLWHDYCPDPDVIQSMSSVQGVTKGIERLLPYIREQFTECFWINPSWLLVGIKK